MRWARLRRLRIALVLGFVGFVVVVWGVPDRWMESIDGFLDAHRLSDDWLFVGIVLLATPVFVLALLLRAFRCPSCGGRFFPRTFGNLIFRSACTSCGARVGQR